MGAIVAATKTRDEVNELVMRGASEVRQVLECACPLALLKYG